MKTGTILVSFGTSHEDARKNSLERIYEDIAAVNQGNYLDQAYTSGMIIEKLAKENVRIHTVEEAAKQAKEHGVERLLVVTTHMIPGIEYNKMRKLLEPYPNDFKEIKITAPVLDRKEDCEAIVPLIREMYQIREDYEYILMGHGSEDEANIRYAQMNEAFQKAGLFNVRIASVEARPELEDAMNELKMRPKVQKVLLYPFMVVAGDHAKNDMAGEEDSYKTELCKAGYEVEVHIKGLGEYPEFRNLYTKKLTTILQEQ
jgi:sirohydrochlorin cobaltochelatase